MSHTQLQEKVKMKNLHIKCKNMESRQNVIGILESMGFKRTGLNNRTLSLFTWMEIEIFGEFYVVVGGLPETQEETLTCDEFISKYGNVRSLQSVSPDSGINASLDSENAELRNSVRVLSDDKERLVKLLEIANQNSISWQGMSYKNNFLLTTLVYVVFGLIIGAVLAWMI